MVAPDRLLVLTPIAPARTGNGLAMRVANLIDVAARDRDVTVVVVPAAGEGPVQEPLARTIVVAPRADPDPSGFVPLLADPWWRDRLSIALPLPWRARVASPDLAEGIAAELDEAPGMALHAVRSYLAPLGLAIAARIGASRRTLDLDDDDEAMLLAAGEPVQAEEHRRLIAAFAPDYDALSAASADAARHLAARHRLDVAVVPNAIAIPDHPSRQPVTPPDLLLVGNLTYEPNAEAAVILAEQVLPAVRERTGAPVTASLVGPHWWWSPVARLGDLDGVTVTGFVDDLAPRYAAASVAVVPLTAASGSRIKLLEAFAHEVPVVCTPAAASGLDVIDGTHLLLAATPAALADRVASVLADASMAARLTAAARRLVAERYSIDAVAPAIRRMLVA